MERLCRYLTSVSTQRRRAARDPSRQRGYPAAPFIPIVDDPPSELLATGPVVGLLHRNEVWHAWLFRATDFCWQAVDSLEQSHPYEVEAAVAFLDCAPDRPRAEAAADRLGRLVREQRLVALDPDGLDAYPVAPGYAPGEHHFPHDYARTPSPSRARGSPTTRWHARWTTSPTSSRRTAAGRSAGASWAPGTALEARPW